MPDTKYVRHWVKGSPQIHATEPGWELFDLERDPHELNTVARDPEYATVFEDMKQLLLKKKKEVGDTDDKYPELMNQRKKYW